MLENGDLSEFICLVRDHKEKVPNTVLWRFLLCLVRMCIAMAYPPASLPGNRNVPGPITETVPPEGLRAKWFKRMVHFDMDPKNIFVGDLMVGPEHRVTPILKLGDFGLAQEVRERMEGGYYERLRYIGKVGYYCPEQFCQDWDYIPENSKKTYKHPIAGNYGPHSNLWAAGYVMETLITLCYPAQPPHPTKTTRNPPRSKTEYLTYAAHLSQSLYSHVDPDLISVIFRLQAHSPADRPDLADLENYVLNRYPAGLRERNSATEWIQKVLYEPPPQRSSFDPAAAYAQIKVYRPALIPVPVLSSSSAEQGKGGVEEEIKRKKLPGLQDRRDLEVAPQNQNQEPPTPRPALARALAPIPLPIPPRLNPPVGELNRPRPTPGFQAPVGELNRPRPPPGSQGGSRNTAGSGRGRGGETRRPTRPPWRF
ncbi:kinase-like domain-containing protein [Poronia punctata]|nr:kinase-like domain-containing protein [Poronia punctata]